MEGHIKNNLLFILTLLVTLLAPQRAVAQAMWTDAPIVAAQAKGAEVAASRFSRVRRVAADTYLLKSALAMAPMERTQGVPAQIQLPMPNGEMMSFDIEESPIMSANSASRIAFKSYRVSAVSDPAFSGRLDLGPHGFHGMIQTDKGMVFIDPVSSSQIDQYNSYYKRDYIRDTTKSFSCGVQSKQTIDDSPVTTFKSLDQSYLSRTSNELLTYDIAVAATVEYNDAIGGGVPATTALEIASAINRVNVIFERDLAISLNLVASDGTLISTSADDFSSNDPVSILDTTDAQDFIESKISASSYDIGHVFTTGSGGVAGLGVVCDSTAITGFDTHKTKGITGIGSFIPGNISSAKDDPFYIDLVAHEIGHQFGANHSFNGTTNSCASSNRNAATAYEPGSGTTIMAYAGICGAENIQNSSDVTFHAGSIEEIIAYSRTGGGSACSTNISPTGNTAPVVDKGLNYTIPTRTPFTLTGSATDADPLLYQWDEMDVGVATSSTTIGTDLITNALFRSFAPSSSPDRTFPQLSTILGGVVDIGETLPTQDRTLNFRLTVRDGNGGVDEDDVVLTVDGFSGPFTVLQPSNFTILNTPATHAVEWNSACTEMAPVSCGNVDILLTTDNGVSFSSLLPTGSTPNVGTAMVDFPAMTSPTTRLKIACVNNIFFDLSDQDFSLVQDGSGQTLSATGAGGSFNCNVPTIITGTGDDVEPNDFPAQAQLISIPFSISGSVNDVADTDDFYEFTSTGGAYSFTLSDYGSTDLDLYLMDSTGTQILSESISPDGLTEKFSLGLASGQIYYIRVNGFDTAGQDVVYKLDITNTPPVTTGGGGDDGGGAVFYWLLGLIISGLFLRFASNSDKKFIH